MMINTSPLDQFKINVITMIEIIPGVVLRNDMTDHTARIELRSLNVPLITVKYRLPAQQGPFIVDKNATMIKT